MRENTVRERAIARVAAIVVIGAAVGSGSVAYASGPEIDGRGNHFYLNDAWSGQASNDYLFGRVTDGVLVGDWDGDGIDTLAFRRGATYAINNDHDDQADVTINYGRADDEVLVGDWDGDGIDTLAVRRGRTYYVKNSVAPGSADAVVNYGRESDLVLVGDWDGDGTDTFAVRRGRTYYVKNSVAPGSADIVLNYGREGDTALAGDWNGDLRVTLGVRRQAGSEISPLTTSSDLDCADFSQWLQAQSTYDYWWLKGSGDKHRLDADGDGVACESRFDVS